MTPLIRKGVIGQICHRPRANIAALIVHFVAVANCSHAEETIYVHGTPPGIVDLGDITSTGQPGRHLYIAPTDPANPYPHYRFFPPHDILPDAFPDPTPDSPAQDAVQLFEDASLTVVIPQLSHFPTGANVRVSHVVSGNEILVQATINYLSYATATIYGPHEYLWPIGTFTVGDYRLTFDFIQTFELEPLSHTTGFVRFSVLPVPEPSTIPVFVIVGAFLALVCPRECRRTC